MRKHHQSSAKQFALTLYEREGRENAGTIGNKQKCRLSK